MAGAKRIAHSSLIFSASTIKLRYYGGLKMKDSPQKLQIRWFGRGIFYPANMTKYFLWVWTNTLRLMANLWNLASLASQIHKINHWSLRVFQDPDKLILSSDLKNRNVKMLWNKDGPKFGRITFISWQFQKITKLQHFMA